MDVKFLKISTLERHLLHGEMSIEKNTDALVELAESFGKHGKVIPLVCVNLVKDGALVPHVIDGWSSVLVARENGIDELPAIIIDNCSDEELPELLAHLHSNYHNDPEEDYKRFKFFYNRYTKGRGFRSDLIKQEEE